MSIFNAINEAPSLFAKVNEATDQVTEVKERVDEVLDQVPDVISKLTSASNLVIFGTILVIGIITISVYRR